MKPRFLSENNPTPTLNPPGSSDWLWRIACGLVLAALLSERSATGAETNGVVLRTAAAVRELSPEEAARKVPVQLRGVVTFFNETLFSRFIQDETAGIYLFDVGLPVHFTPGQIVEVRGVTGPGEYAPIVVPESITLVGEGALPAARPVTFEQLASGQEDSQFVEISGIVRSAYQEEGAAYFLVHLATGGGRLSVYAPQLPVARPEQLVDATVRVRGVCSTQFNRQRQLFAIRLLVPRPEDLIVEIPAPADPYEIPARRLDSLLQFTPQENFGHRVRVTGTVTYYEPGRMLFLDDGQHGLEVQTRERVPLQPGDRVEALGFPARGEYTPVLQDAVFRKTGSGPNPLPARVTPDDALKGTYDCRLVRLSANLLDRAQHGTQRYLVLQEGESIFHAWLNPSEATNPFAELKNGSRVQVTGICRIEPGEWRAGEEWRAKAFRLLMRSAADVTLLRAPPWWTLRKVLWMAGALACVAAGAFAWVAVLQRQVAERTRQLEKQIQERQRAERQQLIEQERTRVAQDLHDELGAALTEVSMLGTLARTPSLPAEQRERYLEQLTEVARKLVSILDEIVWAVNPKYDSVASLASYYSLFAQRFLNLAGIACRLDVAESFPNAPLDARVRHSVFLAFREALNNAVRHSRATEVRVAMAAREGWLHIRVHDNGCGFVPSGDTPARDGLAGMRERLRQLGGQCEVRSEPGAGTTVEFRLPIEEGTT